jgi:putative oxidoreductase
MTRWLNSLQPYGVVLLRLVLGAAMIYNSWDKVYPIGGFNGHYTFSPEQHFCHFVASLGLPYWLGYVSVFTEFVGGICLLAGLFIRFFSLLVAINMLVAIATVNRHHGYTGSEYSIALAAIAVMLLLTGPGTMALDRRLGLH